MSTTEPLEAGAVTASFENLGDWEAVTAPIARGTGLPLPLGPEALLAMIGSAVALMADATATGELDRLRGTFAAPVVAQCKANAEGLLSGRPTAVAVHLAAGRCQAGHGVIRVHLAIQGTRGDGAGTIDRHFWDLELGGQVTVAQVTCPECGGPVAGGALVCGYCGSDVRTVVEAPVVVTRLELY